MLTILIKRCYKGDNAEDNYAFSQLPPKNNSGFLNLLPNHQQPHRLKDNHQYKMEGSQQPAIAVQNSSVVQQTGQILPVGAAGTLGDAQLHPQQRHIGIFFAI